MATSPEILRGPVLLFDGECGFCRRVVVWLKRLDRRGALQFAPLQGPESQVLLRARGLPMNDFDSLIFVPDWAERDRVGLLFRTNGALAALRCCGGAGRMLAVVGILPAPWRDAAYRLVARNRMR